MKSYICNVILLLSASTDAFTPQPLTFANTVRRRAAHTAHAPHQNSYLEQLAATPIKEQENEKSAAPEPTISMEAAATAAAPSTQQQDEEEDSAKSLLQKVKQAGTAGAISYALWELGAQQLLPIVLRMQLFQNSNEILPAIRQFIKDFGELVSQCVLLVFRS